jgi:methionyl aminopeptidase
MYTAPLKPNSYLVTPSLPVPAEI